MMCKSPYFRNATTGVIDRKLEAVKNGLSKYFPIACGQCLHCRINKQRVMKLRMLLESMTWPYSVMVTLTYDEYHLPGPSLDPRDLCKYIKRVRRHFKYHYDIPVRYFGCGEYGRSKFRPHFHVAFFGDLEKADLKIFESKWSKNGTKFGRTQVGRLEHGGCGYLSHYLTKGLRNTDKRIAKMGLEPEFMRLSQGLGKETAKIIAERTISNKYWDKKPITELKISGKSYPLGRYLSTYIHGELMLENEAKAKGYDFMVDEMEECGGIYEIINAKRQKRLQQEKKFEIWTSKKRKI